MGIKNLKTKCRESQLKFPELTGDKWEDLKAWIVEYKRWLQWINQNKVRSEDITFSAHRLEWIDGLQTFMRELEEKEKFENQRYKGQLINQ